MSDLASVVFDRHDDIVVGVLSGEIDQSNAMELESLISDAVPNTVRGLVLDPSGITYIDSAGVRSLISLAGRLRWRGQELVLAVPPDARCRRVLSLAGVGTTIPIKATLREGRSLLRDPAPPT
jgi:anti-sigma B factor antagonist